MNIEKERELFEAWLFQTEKFKNRNKLFLFMLDENGNYEDTPVFEHWQTWRAAKAQAVPESNALLSAAMDAVQKLGSGDFVLVPKEPTLEMCHRGRNTRSFKVQDIYKAMIEVQE